MRSHPHRSPVTIIRVVLMVVLVPLLASACSSALRSSGLTPGSEAPSVPSEPRLSPADLEHDAWLVVGEAGTPGLRVVLASTREELLELPEGVPGKDWGGIVTTRSQGTDTALDEVVVQPDLPTWRSRSLEGDWRLPTIGHDPLPVGVSADGTMVVLVEASPPADAVATRFAVLADNEPARVIELPGSLEFDALSPDGEILYVVEHLPGPPEARYQVRAVDVATGRMRPEIIVDKRNLEARMGGWPITQASHPSGVVFTLYRSDHHPFIHALNTREAWAVCLDLPEIGHEDAEAALDWGIAQSDDGRAVFAVNATLGLAVAIDPSELSIRQASAFDAPHAAATIELAKFGHEESGPTGRRVVAAPDGSFVFAAGAGGVVRIETARLTATGTFLEGVSVEALALATEADVLFALTEDGRILWLDGTTGKPLGQVPGDAYDRLVAIVSW